MPLVLVPPRRGRAGVTRPIRSVPCSMQIRTFAGLAGMRWLRRRQSAINILVEGFRSGETDLRIRSRRRVRHI